MSEQLSSPAPACSGRNRGFTLLELLVAITIFSLVVGMAMFSLRYSFGIFRHLDAPFAEATQRSSRLRDCLSSTFNYICVTTDQFNMKKSFSTYFYGERDRVSFVSTRPLAVKGLALCRITLRDRDVVLEEAPIYTPGNDYLKPTLESPQKQETVLYANVTGLNFEYFQGDRKVTSLKEEIPSLVRMELTDDNGPREFFYRITTDFVEKKQLIRGLHEPL
jgi:prepilin-type N-terminal cleavage/methylation domain-containing protein